MTQHFINTRALTRYHSFENNLNTNKNYLFDLSYLGILDLLGDKALDFLQQQITSDVRLISEKKMSPGAFCNLKGRILSFADCIFWDGIKLILPKDLLETIKKTLEKPGLLSRVHLEENTSLKLFGLYYQNPKDLLPVEAPLPSEGYAQNSTSQYCCYHCGHHFYIFIIPAEHEVEFCELFIKNNQLLGSLSWHTLRLRQGVVDIYPESSGLFLPHRLDLQKTPYLAFDKGCYKGQEVIARMHYLAHLKQELKLYRIKTKEKLYSGQKLLSEVEIGELIDYAPLLNEEVLIAVSVLKDFSGKVFTIEGHKAPVSLYELT